MKRLFFVIAILASCNPSSQENTGANDSTSVGYEDFSEVTPFTIKEEIRDNAISINGKSKTLQEYLTTFYYPDTFTAKSQADSVGGPKYIITEATIIEGEFFAGEGKCEKRSILLTIRGDFIDQEFYDLLFLAPKASGEMAVVAKETFDGSQGQSSTMVTVEKESLSKDKNCFLLEVTSASEGGDTNLHKDEWLQYYMADEKGFHPILKLQLEKTDILGFEVTHDLTQNSSSEVREIKVLETISHGLYDISVHYVNRQDGNTVADVQEDYSFDGSEYVRR